MHRYRIDWNATDVAYFIDDVEVVRHTVQITPQMQILAASDFDEAEPIPGVLVARLGAAEPVPDARRRSCRASSTRARQ